MLNAKDYYDYGIAKVVSGDNEGVIADFNEVIQLKPDFAEAYNNRGFAKGLSGDNQGAINDLHQEAKLFQQQNKADLSQIYFQQAMAVAPQDPQVALQRGIFDCQNDHFEAAFEQFKRALGLSLGPLQVRTNWIWGQCLRRNKQFEASNERMSYAFAQQPGLISEALELVELNIQLGKYIEAEKILEYLNDSPSVSAQSECVAFQLAERQNQAVIKTKFGARC
jgi:Tfp pilus assembly protein PilF